MSKFTDKQIENFTEFEGIRVSGVINMFDAKTGCEMTGMTKEVWFFCMKNYNELNELSERK